MAANASPLPDPEVIRRTAEEVTQRPEYQLESAGASNEALTDLLLEILYRILTPLRWLFEMTAGLAEWLRWLIVLGLVLTLVLLITHIVYTIMTALRGPKRASGYTLEEERHHLDPAALELQADDALARLDYISAVRLLFRSILLRLEEHEGRKHRAGMTNREYLYRYRKSPISQSMKPFVETIDIKWYGLGVCSMADYEACRRAHSNIRQMTQEAENANSS